MNTLDPSLHDRIAPLLTGDVAPDCLPSLYSVIEGNAPATIFVDSADNPSRAVVVMPGGWVFPLGVEDRDFVHRDMPQLLAQCDVGYPLFAIWASSTKWQNVLAESYALWMTRVHFKYAGATADRQTDGQAKYVRPIDFGAMTDMAGTLDPWLPARWSAIGESKPRTFGYCVTIDGELASAAWAGLVGMQVAQFDVVTNPAHLRQGYGEAVCRAMLAHCAAENLVPYWSTDLANTPSFHLALKLGFEPASKAVAYVWCRELIKPEPKWGSDLTGIDVRPPGSFPAVQVTLRPDRG